MLLRGTSNHLSCLHHIEAERITAGPDLEKGWYGTAAVAAVGIGNDSQGRLGLASRLARLRGFSDFGCSLSCHLHLFHQSVQKHAPFASLRQAKMVQRHSVHTLNLLVLA